MKAIFFRQHGGLENLEYGELPTPEPKPGQALVRIHAAALNRLDLWVREGWPGLKLALPHIPGADGAGQIAALGDGSNGWQVGERVSINANLGCGQCDFCLAGQDNLCRDWHLLGETISGTYGQFALIPTRNLFRLPESVDYPTAAAAGLVYQTAWHSLVTRGNLRPGEIVLIIGASGGVNTASIVIAKFAGAKVIVVGSGKQKLELAERLGADILVDRSQEEDWSKTIYKLTNKNGVDIVVDNVGTTFPLSFRALRKGGRLLTVGNTGGPKFEIDNRFVFSKHISIIGSTMGSIKDYTDVMNLVCSAKLKVAVDQIFPLKEAKTAQEKLAKGEQLGKIVLEID